MTINGFDCEYTILRSAHLGPPTYRTQPSSDDVPTKRVLERLDIPAFPSDSAVLVVSIQIMVPGSYLELSSAIISLSTQNTSQTHFS